MQTINSNVNFTGVYRIPNTPKNIKEINEKVIPMYSFLKHEPALGFPGENPFVLGFEVLKDVVAKANNASKSWLEMNAQYHGEMLPDTNTDFLHIVSGKKDLADFVNFIVSRVKANQNTPLKYIKSLFARHKDEKDLPEHLKVVDKAIDVYQKERLEYLKFIQTKKVVPVETTQELLTKMLMER